MKRGFGILSLLLIIPSVFALTGCPYDTNEVDVFEQNCLECSSIWNGQCCDDVGEYFCQAGAGACVGGVPFLNHCQDGVQDCDEGGVDCGGADCQPCCVVSVADNYCPEFCSPDQDFDCCVDLGNVGWASDQRCCESGDAWISVQGSSCYSGAYYSNHCTDNVRNFDEFGVDCGGVDCSACISDESDGVCSSFIIGYPTLNEIQGDPDCCRLGIVQGEWQEGKCCSEVTGDWCLRNGGSCIFGEYYSNHCSDGELNLFCGDVDNGESTLYSFETAVDCGGDCGECSGGKGLGEDCSYSDPCMNDFRCSGAVYDEKLAVVSKGHCCPEGLKWKAAFSECTESFYNVG